MTRGAVKCFFAIDVSCRMSMQPTTSSHCRLLPAFSTTQTATRAGATALRHQGQKCANKVHTTLLMLCPWGLRTAHCADVLLKTWAKMQTYLHLTSCPALAPQPGPGARYYQRGVLDYCVEHVAAPTGEMDRDGASSTGRRCRQRGVAVVAIARLAGSLDRPASSAGGSSQGHLAGVGRVVGGP